jgi:hypothetical protein
MDRRVIEFESSPDLSLNLKRPAMGRLFFSYGRADSAFVLKLAKDLRSADIDLWVDQLDIVPGDRWDRAIETALAAAPSLLVVLSPDSVNSQNVMDEVSLGFDEGKRIIPILLRPCNVPFRLRRLQHVDFTNNYDTGLAELVRALKSRGPSDAQAPAGSTGQPSDPQVAEATTPQPADTRVRAPAQVSFVAEPPATRGRSRSSLFSRSVAVIAIVAMLAGLGAVVIPALLKRRPDAPPPPPAAAGSTTSSAPKYGIDYFTGSWGNVDAQTRGITRLAIRADGSNMFVRAWGRCHPNDCEWGEVPAQAYGEGVSTPATANIRTLSALFKTNFDEATLTIRPGDGATLTVDDMTHFTDNSGRANFTSSQTFRRAQ